MGFRQRLSAVGMCLGKGGNLFHLDFEFAFIELGDEDFMVRDDDLDAAIGLDRLDIEVLKPLQLEIEVKFHISQNGEALQLFQVRKIREIQLAERLEGLHFADLADLDRQALHFFLNVGHIQPVEIGKPRMELLEWVAQQHELTVRVIAVRIEPVDAVIFHLGVLDDRFVLVAAGKFRR